MSDEVTRQVAELRAERNVAREQYDWMVRDRDAAREERDAALEERDAALTDNHCLRLELERIRAEVEGLRADLLAPPPELHQELAIERKRHRELMEDYERQNVVIGMLEDAVKRAENALATAQAKHVNPRIPGYAATIAQLASQIEDLLS